MQNANLIYFTDMVQVDSIWIEVKPTQAMYNHPGQWAAKHFSPGKARELLQNIEWILIRLLFQFSLEQRAINSKRQSCPSPVSFPRDKSTLLWRCQLCNKRHHATYEMKSDTLMQFCLTMSALHYPHNQSNDYFLCKWARLPFDKMPEKDGENTEV